MKWGAPEPGTGATATWGLLRAEAEFPDAVNCRAMAPVERVPLLGAMPRLALERLVREAFALWSEAAGIRFRQAAPGVKPDILIGAHAEPRKIAFANVWWNADAAEAGMAPLTAATICLNPEADWRLGGLGSRAPNAVDLRHALAHEIGHTLGLDHPGATGALMGYRSSGEGRLMAGDVEGAQRLYGPAPPGVIVTARRPDLPIRASARESSRDVDREINRP